MNTSAPSDRLQPGMRVTLYTSDATYLGVILNRSEVGITIEGWRRHAPPSDPKFGAWPIRWDDITGHVVVEEQVTEPGESFS
jgi:hypothetical protein